MTETLSFKISDFKERWFDPFVGLLKIIRGGKRKRKYTFILPMISTVEYQIIVPLLLLIFEDFFNIPSTMLFQPLSICGSHWIDWCKTLWAFKISKDLIGFQIKLILQNKKNISCSTLNGQRPMKSLSSDCLFICPSVRHYIFSRSDHQFFLILYTVIADYDI